MKNRRKQLLPHPRSNISGRAKDTAWAWPLARPPRRSRTFPRSFETTFLCVVVGNVMELGKSSIFRPSSSKIFNHTVNTRWSTATRKTGFSMRRALRSPKLLRTNLKWKSSKSLDDLGVCVSKNVHFFTKMSSQVKTNEKSKLSCTCLLAWEKKNYQSSF